MLKNRLQKGATLIEYALIVALIALAVLVAGAVVAPAINGVFSDVAGALDTSADTGGTGV